MGAGRRHRGYTIVEVLLVIVILGVLGTVAGPRFFDNDVFDERAYYDELVSALRYAHRTAIASGCPVRVDVGVSSYALAQQAASAGHISNTMHVIQEITSQTSAGTTDTARSIGNLAEMTNELRSSVAGFKLPERPEAADEPAVDDNGVELDLPEAEQA